MQPSAPTSLLSPLAQPSMLGPMRPSPMGQSAGTPTNGPAGASNYYTGPPSSGPSPQFGAPPTSGPSPRMGAGPPTSSSFPTGPLSNGPVSGPPLTNGPSPRPIGPLTNGPSSQFAPPPLNGPSAPYSGQSYNGQFGGPPLNGPQFGTASLNGPTSQFRGPSPQVVRTDKSCLRPTAAMSSLTSLTLTSPTDIDLPEAILTSRSTVSALDMA